MYMFDRVFTNFLDFTLYFKKEIFEQNREYICLSSPLLLMVDKCCSVRHYTNEKTSNVISYSFNNVGFIARSFKSFY